MPFHLLSASSDMSNRVLGGEQMGGGVQGEPESRAHLGDEVRGSNWPRAESHSQR